MEKEKKQKVDTQKLVWLHPQNQAFVEGKTKSLTDEDEVFKNIAQSKGFPTNMKFQWIPTLGYAFRFLFILPLMILMGIFFVSIIPYILRDGLLFILAVMIPSLIGFLILFYSTYTTGRKFIYSVSWVEKHVQSTYNNLVQNGTIRYAKIIQTYQYNDHTKRKLTFQYLDEKEIGVYLAGSSVFVNSDEIVRVLVSDDGVAILL